MNAVRIVVGGLLGGGSAATGEVVFGGIKGAAVCFTCAMIAWIAGILWVVD